MKFAYLSGVINLLHARKTRSNDTSKDIFTMININEGIFQLDKMLSQIKVFTTTQQPQPVVRILCIVREKDLHICYISNEWSSVFRGHMLLSEVSKKIPKKLEGISLAFCRFELMSGRTNFLTQFCRSFLTFSMSAALKFMSRQKEENEKKIQKKIKIIEQFWKSQKL